MKPLKVWDNGSIRKIQTVNKYINDNDWYEWSVLFNSGVVVCWNCVVPVIDGWVSEHGTLAAWYKWTDQSTLRKACPIASLWTTNPAWTGLEIDLWLLRWKFWTFYARAWLGVSEKCCHKYMIQNMLKVKYWCGWHLLACDAL